MFDRGHFPYPLPGAGGTLRVSLVGAPPELAADADGLQVTTAEAPDPDAHVVVVFDPQEPVDVRGVTIGWFTQVLRHPRARSRPDNSDLAPAAPPAGAFDRVISADPGLAEHVDVWRSLPLPVADELFADVEVARERPVVAWAAGPPRDEAKLAELVLAPAGSPGAHVVVNIHPDHWPRFEPEVARHLAAGRLVISEQLAPLHGLEPDLDFLQADDPDRILDFLWTLERFPAEFDRVRHRGRLKAEYFRASRVWPRLIHDLLLDVREFGTARVTA